jgi:hypothetical protein
VEYFVTRGATRKEYFTYGFIANGAFPFKTIFLNKEGHVALAVARGGTHFKTFWYTWLGFMISIYL